MDLQLFYVCIDDVSTSYILLGIIVLALLGIWLQLLNHGFKTESLCTVYQFLVTSIWL